MAYSDSVKHNDVFSVLKFKEHNVLGRVVSINETELSFQSISEDEIPMHSLQYMDVITSGRIHFRNLPVKIISDRRVQNEISFSRMSIREITVRSDSPGLDAPFIQLTETVPETN
jgi:hypothetical protein